MLLSEDEVKLLSLRRLSSRDNFDYSQKADPSCKSCLGRGTYYYCNPHLASGISVICHCVPDAWKWLRKGKAHLFSLIVMGLGLAFWIWTAILWWRWFWTLI